jgi:hypothetical protein
VVAVLSLVLAVVAVVAAAVVSVPLVPPPHPNAATARASTPRPTVTWISVVFGLSMCSPPFLATYGLMGAFGT